MILLIITRFSGEWKRRHETYISKRFIYLFEDVRSSQPNLCL